MASLNDSFFRREGEKLREAFARGEEGHEREEMLAVAEAENQQESLRADQSEVGETSRRETVEEEQYEEEQGEGQEERGEQPAAVDFLPQAEDAETSAVSSANTSSHRSILDSPTVKLTSASPRRSVELSEAQESRDTGVAGDAPAQEASAEHGASPAPSLLATSSPAPSMNSRFAL